MIALLVAASMAASATALAQDVPIADGERGASTGETASGDAPSGDAPSGDAPSGDAPSSAAPRSETSGDAPSEDTEPRGATLEHATAPSSGASGALGVTTILGAVATAASLGFWLEREDNVGVCARYAMDDPSTLGCLNTAAIGDQRDVGIGLTIGFGALTISAAIAWAVVVATTPAPPAEAGLTCAPGVLSIACAGRF